MPSHARTSQRDPERSEDERGPRIRYRAAYFKSIQKASGWATNANNQREAERRRRQTPSSQINHTAHLCIEVRDDKRRVTVRNSPQPQRHHQRRVSNSTPNGFFGVTHTTPSVFFGVHSIAETKDATDSTWCIVCKEKTSTEHAEEHRFETDDGGPVVIIEDIEGQQQAMVVEEVAETVSDNEGSIDFQATQVQQPNAEENTTKMREELIEASGWFKLLRSIRTESEKEEGIIKEWVQKFVLNKYRKDERKQKARESASFIKAKPAEAKKIRAFLWRVRKTIEGDEMMMRAWEKKLQ